MSNKDFNMRAYIDIINESNKVEEGIWSGLAGAAKAAGSDVATGIKKLGDKVGGTKLGQKVGEYKDAYNYNKYSADDIARYDALVKKHGLDADEVMFMGQLSKNPKNLERFRKGQNSQIPDDQLGGNHMLSGMISQTDDAYRRYHPIPTKDAKFMADLEGSGAGYMNPGEAAHAKWVKDGKLSRAHQKRVARMEKYGPSNRRGRRTDMADIERNSGRVKYNDPENNLRGTDYDEWNNGWGDSDIFD